MNPIRQSCTFSPPPPIHFRQMVLIPLPHLSHIHLLRQLPWGGLVVEMARWLESVVIGVDCPCNQDYEAGRYDDDEDEDLTAVVNLMSCMGEQVAGAMAY